MTIFFCLDYLFAGQVKAYPQGGALFGLAAVVVEAGKGLTGTNISAYFAFVGDEESLKFC